MNFPDFSKQVAKENIISKNVHKDIFPSTKEAYFTGSKEQIAVRIYPKIKQIKSFKMHTEEFTNYLGKKVPPQITIRLEEMKKSLTKLKKLKPDPVNGILHDSRLKKIIETSLNDSIDDDLEDRIYKITLLDSFDAKTPIRVYLIYEIEDNDGEFSYYESIFLIDLFHLVIPSKHNGMSKEKYRNITYKENANNNRCLSIYFS